MRLLVALSLAIPWAEPVRCRADCLCGTAADDLAAERAGLEREWLVQIPFDASTSTLEHVVVDPNLVVVQTGDGNVVAVQAGSQQAGTPAPGTILWKHPIDRLAGPFQAASIGADLVTVAHGDGIHAFDRQTGQSLWNRRFGHLADAGATVSGWWVYAPYGDGKIMRLPTNPHRQPSAAGKTEKELDPGLKKKPADRATRKKGKTGPQKVESLEPVVLEAGGSVSLQPRPFRGGVLWCTDDGVLVVLDPAEDGWRRNEFFLDRPPACRPVVHAEAIFAATTDGDLVRIDASDDAGGDLRLTWRVLLDTATEGPLFVAGDRLVVPLGIDGMAAFDVKTGDVLWKSALQGQLVAVTAGRVWIIDRLGRLAGIDAATAEPRERFCLGGFSFPVTNQTSDRLILASPAGAVVSLKARGDAPKHEPTP